MAEKIKAILAKRPVKGIFFILALILILTAVFSCRKPVILVTDRAFTVLYGEKRTRIAQLSLSLRFFRQIKTIHIAEGASPDLTAQGAASLSRRPFAVFFPYRYREGARRYLSDRPGSPVVILGGRNRPEPPAGAETPAGAAEPLWLCTDTETDLFRAGALTGNFTRTEAPYNTKILLYQEELGKAETTAFSRGVEEFWSGAPVFSSELSDREIPGVACAVTMRFFLFNWEEPPRSVIFFSWMDPALAPRNTLAVFDDSPWVQLDPALALLKT